MRMGCFCNDSVSYSQWRLTTTCIHYCPCGRFNMRCGASTDNLSRLKTLPCRSRCLIYLTKVVLLRDSCSHLSFDDDLAVAVLGRGH